MGPIMAFIKDIGGPHNISRLISLSFHTYMALRLKNWQIGHRMTTSYMGHLNSPTKSNPNHESKGSKNHKKTYYCTQLTPPSTPLKLSLPQFACITCSSNWSTLIPPSWEEFGPTKLLLLTKDESMDMEVPFFRPEGDLLVALKRSSWVSSHVMGATLLECPWLA